MHSDIKAKLVESLIERALTYQKSGSCDKAALIYRGLLRRHHQSARVFTNYGAVQYEAGRKEDGIKLFEMALRLDPSYNDAWKNLTVDANLTNGDFLIRISNEILCLNPDNTKAQAAQANGYITNGRHEKAIEIWSLLLEKNPDDLALHEAISRCYLALGDLDSAIAHLLFILSFDPGNVFASIQMSDVAAIAGDYQSSIDILQAAAKCNPKEYRINLKLARIYQSNGNLHQALEFYKLAEDEARDSAVVLGSMAYCFAEIGNTSRFFQLYDRILSLNSFNPESLVPLIFVCSTLGEKYLHKLKKYSLLFWNSLPQANKNTSNLGQNRKIATDAHAVGSSFGHASKRRVGILTGDLGSHVVSSFLASFLLNYSKEALDVEVISNQWRNDPIAETLSRSVDKCMSIANYGENAARELILSREYDVIIETSGFTSGSAMHLLRERCAPVQCHWIGYHASTYMLAMDYFIGDSILIPDTHSIQFSEQIVRLERAWLAAVPFAPIPEATFKSPGEEVVIGAFSQIGKLKRETLSLWSKVLLKAPHVKLLLKDKFTNDPQMKRKIINFLSSRSVDEHRIIFVERTHDWFEHMALYNMLDLAMDTTPWSSATTAFDALSMGVPLVALKSKTTSGMMSSSVVCHGGRANWVAETEEEYVEKCLHIIECVQYHRKFKKDFQSEILQSQLFDGKEMALAIQNFVLNL